MFCWSLDGAAERSELLLFVGTDGEDIRHDTHAGLEQWPRLWRSVEGRNATEELLRAPHLSYSSINKH